MSRNSTLSSLLRIGVAVLLVAAGVKGGEWWTARTIADGSPSGHEAVDGTPAVAPPSDRKVLYWYDPMSPQHRFDKPGKSPFMDMDLVPRYADEAGTDDAGATVRIDPGATQNLGVRRAPVRRIPAETVVEASAVLNFNERDVAIVQARTGGFVERVAPLAPGDVLRQGAFIAEVLVPEWAARQYEYLALRNAGDRQLLEAARSRLRLAGMPESLIRKVETSGRTQDRIAITAPRAGVLQELGVRQGMTLGSGQTVARINGIGTVWLDVAVPEASASGMRIDQRGEVRFVAFPGEVFEARVAALLPSLDERTRTLTVRLELPNGDARLRPGLTALARLAGGSDRTLLAVPTEAVIRTGKRAIVMLAEEGGRFRPVEVTLGDEIGNDTVILSGLTEGKQVIVSGQFLIDSEASLMGLLARADERPAAGSPGVALHEAEATIEEIGDSEVTISHGPFKTLAMPGMTMPFPLARPELLQGFKVGDRVRVGVRQSDDGLVVESIRSPGDKP